MKLTTLCFFYLLLFFLQYTGVCFGLILLGLMILGGYKLKRNLYYQQIQGLISCRNSNNMELEETQL